MNNLIIQKGYPNLLLDFQTDHYVQYLFDIYEESVRMTRYCPFSYLPTIEDFTEDEAMSDILLDMASEDIAGKPFLWVSEEEENIDVIFERYDELGSKMVSDIFTVVDYYSLAFQIHDGRNTFLNLPVKGVW